MIVKPTHVRVAYTIETSWHRVPGGTGVAALELARSLVERGDVDLIGVAGRHRAPAPDTWAPPMPVRQLPVPGQLIYDWWIRAGRPSIDRFVPGVDVVHASNLFVPPTSRPLVVTLHDLAFRHEPSWFTPRGVRLFNLSIERIKRRAARVMCSSLATLRDARDAGIDPNILVHVPLGTREPLSLSSTQVDAALDRLGVRRPYVLAVGTAEPRKNLQRLVSAFAKIADDVADLTLVVTGPAGWGDSVTVPAPVASRVHRTGFVTDSDLAALYSGSAVFCYPSLIEGFGLPVIEAMSYGVRVVTSRGTSTEELVGSAGWLVDPSSVDSIGQGLLDAFADTSRRADTGPARSAQYRWATTAEQVASVYRSVL